MISVEDLNFYYGKNLVINSISAEFKSGKFYCIIGPNGSGKSTFLSLISGLLKANNGNIFIDNIPLFKYAPKSLANKLSLLPQGKILPEITVEQLVLYGRFPYMGLTQKPTEADKTAVKSAMRRLGILSLKNRNLKKLSGGEVQKAYIAMLLSQDTPYVLLDEPTANLDASVTLDIVKLLKELANGGKCIIAVLHDIPTALHFADEILVINNGEVVFNGLPEKAVESGVINNVFGVKTASVIIEKEKRYIVFKE